MIISFEVQYIVNFRVSKSVLEQQLTNHLIPDVDKVVCTKRRGRLSMGVSHFLFKGNEKDGVFYIDKIMIEMPCWTSEFVDFFEELLPKTNGLLSIVVYQPCNEGDFIIEVADGVTSRFSIPF